MSAAVSALNGSPFVDHQHGNLTASQLWDVLKTHDADSDVMTAGSHFCGSHDQTNENGVACSHAYTTLGTYVLTKDNGQTVNLVKVRNPWGQEQYAGDWSDSSSLWTDAYRKTVDDAMGHGYANN